MGALNPTESAGQAFRNIQIGNQKNELLAKKLGNVTPTGKNSYGSLNRGGDKLRITQIFAEYVIKKITRLNNAIAGRVN